MTLNKPEELFENIQHFLETFKGDINILDDIVDVETQIEYFEKSKKLKELPLLDDWESRTDILFNKDIDIKEKKELIIRIASLEDVKAYRFLEKYFEQAPEELKKWTRLAIQESRLLIQSKLLDQPQLLISTGLGGKDGKLRYFLVLFSRDKLPFSDFQKKITQDEITFYFQKNLIDIEKIDFYNHYIVVIALFPLMLSVSEVLKYIIQDINQYGNFLSRKCIITNVRLLSESDIENIINKD